MIKEFQCPYCFSTCREDRVLFRSTVGYDETTIRFKMSMSDEGEDQSYWRLFSKNSTDSPQLSRWVSFWEQRGGVQHAKALDPQWNMPYIDPGVPDEFVDMIRATDTGSLKVDPDGFVRDPQGFICRVVDRLGRASTPMQRLCPHCLNPFPLPKYGKYPTCFVGLIGTPGTGKTVYLTRLFEQLRQDAAHTAFKAGDNNFSHSISAERWTSHELPAATAKTEAFYPYAIDLVSENGEDGITLVFYDASGLACTDTLENGLSQTSLAFVRHCDALLLLVDPEQVEDDAAGAYKKQDELQRLMTQLKNTCPDGMADTSILVVLTKVDKLPLTDRLPQSTVEGAAQPYLRKEFHITDQKIRSYIQQHGQTAANILAQIGGNAFFAVSALGMAPVTRAWIGTDCYNLSPKQKEQLLQIRDWITEWNEMAEENGRSLSEAELTERHKWLTPCPCVLAQELPISCIIAADTAVRTDVVLYSAQGAMRTLTLGDVLTMELQLYQNPEAQVQDVESPLRWILWNRGILEPYYDQLMMPEQPRRLFYKRVPIEIWADDWNRAWTASRELFFSGEDDYLLPIENFKERYGVQ